MGSVDELTAALADPSIDRVIVAPGTYPLSSPLGVDRSMELEAAVPGTAVLDGQDTTRVLEITSGALNATLRGLNITRGRTSQVWSVLARPRTSRTTSPQRGLLCWGGSG